MKILIICTRFPYPVNSGLTTRIFNLINILAENNDVEILVLSKKNKICHDIFTKLVNVKNIYYFEISLINRIFNILKYILVFKPIQVGFYYNKNAHRFIKQVASDYDVVIYHLIRVCDFNVIDKRPVRMLEMSDLLSQNYLQTYKMSNIFSPWKYVAGYEYLALKKYELKRFQYFDSITLHSERDLKLLNGLFKSKFFISYQASSLISKVNNRLGKKSLLFLGKIDFYPNKQGLIWFINNIFFHIHQDISLIVIGKGGKYLKSKFKNSKKIIFLDYVDNLEDSTSDCFCGIAPIFINTGMQTKVVDYIGLNLPVIATGNVIDAFPVEMRKHLIMANTTVEWINIINRIYKYPVNLSSDATNFFNGNLTWDAIGSKYVTNLKKLVIDKARRNA